MNSSAICPYCSKQFYDSSSKNRHIRKVHSAKVVIKPKKAHIICSKCPDDNKQSFPSYILLMNHISNYHNIIIKQKKLKFTSNEDFQNWRALEKRNVNYAKESTVRKTNITITYYNCNRSNSHGHQSTCSKRALKRGGSIKINGVCPSRIIAHHNNNTGEVEVNFVETHVGHMDLRSQQLPIAEKLNDSILDENSLDPENVLCIKEESEENLKSNKTIVEHVGHMDLRGQQLPIAEESNDSILDPENVLCIKEEFEENFKSNEIIAELIEEKCSTLKNDRNLNLPDNIDITTRKKIIIESWKSLLDDFYNWDDESFKKLETEYNSFLYKISQYPSAKRKMEEQANV